MRSLSMTYQTNLCRYSDKSSIQVFRFQTSTVLSFQETTTISFAPKHFKMCSYLSEDDIYMKYTLSMQLTQSKSKIQLKEVCTVSSIVLMLTLIGHDMVFLSIQISLGFHLTFGIRVAFSFSSSVLSPHCTNSYSWEQGRRVFYWRAGSILSIQLRKIDLIYIGVDSIILYKLRYKSICHHSVSR